MFQDFRLLNSFKYAYDPGQKCHVGTEAAAANFQYSLNCVDCFSGACVIILIETKKNLHNTPFAAE